MMQSTNWYQRAVAALDVNRLELALQFVIDGLACTPECPLLLALGAHIQIARGAYTEACDFARLAIAKDANWSEGYFQLASALLHLPTERDSDEASSAIARVLELTPNDPGGHQLVGFRAWQSGDLAAAVQSYGRALELDPECAHTLQCLGVVTRQCGLLDESRELLQKWLALNPAGYAGWREFAHWHLDQGNAEAALQCGLAARELQPTDPYTFGMIARAALKLGDFDLALQANNDLQNLLPDNSNVWTFTAELLVACGRYREACEAARRAIERDPNNSKAHFWLVTAMNKMNEFPDG